MALSGNQRSRARRTARATARMQTNPARRAIKREKKEAKQLRNQSLRAAESLAQALAASLGQAGKNLKGVPGLRRRDLGSALAELAQRQVDARAGANLRAQQIQKDYATSVDELNDQLTDVASQRGEITASTFLQLLEQAKDRNLQKAQLQVSRKNARTSARSQRFEEQQAAAEERGDKQENRQDRRSDKINLFQEALSTVRSNGLTRPAPHASQENPNVQVQGSAIVNKAVAKANPSKTMNLIQSKLTDGDRDLARAVYERWVGPGPSRKTLALGSRINYNFGWTPASATRRLTRTALGR